MRLVASENGVVGFEAAWEVLVSGGSALDAVEAGVRQVEDNPEDHTVGFAGHPNVAGVVELDASIMDGTARAAGAVGSLIGFRHAITVARAVMEQTPHVIIVGDGAAQLAARVGLPRENLLTDGEQRAWEEGLADGEDDLLAQVRKLTRDPGDGIGTVNLLAQDARGHLASAVSTSGWAFKHPGRLADSALIGAGNYCDDRFGAAACTGWGELAIRAGTARAAVMRLADGASAEEAACQAIAELDGLAPDGIHPLMNVVVLDRRGDHAAATNWAGTRYVWRSDESAGNVIQPRTLITMPSQGTP
jgi:beta-aspartyl-peptidase (threonine type)